MDDEKDQEIEDEESDDEAPGGSTSQVQEPLKRRDWQSSNQGQSRVQILQQEEPAQPE